MRSTPRLIFLDIDGVLNSNPWLRGKLYPPSVVLSGALTPTVLATQLDPKPVALLNKLVEHTGAEVVLSSEWRRLFGVEKTLAALKIAGFQHEITRSTPCPHATPRSGEIRAFLTLDVDFHAWLQGDMGDNFESLPFVILDDRRDAGETFEPRFVWIDPNAGLQPEHIQAAAKILGRPLPDES